MIIKAGKTYFNGNAQDVYMVQGRASRDGERRAAGEKMLGTVSLACGDREDGSATWIDLNGWRDALDTVANIRKGDQVFAVGVLRSREHNGNTYYALDADFVAVMGATMAAAGRTSYGSAQEFAAIPEDEDDGKLPF